MIKLRLKNLHRLVLRVWLKSIINKKLVTKVKQKMKYYFKLIVTFLHLLKITQRKALVRQAKYMISYYISYFMNKSIKMVNTCVVYNY